MKVIEAVIQDGVHRGWVVDCRACGSHMYDDRWTFNGDRERPTFRASMLVEGALRHAGDGTPGVYGRCHSYVTDGRMEFLADCTHEWKGQTLDMRDL